MIAQNVPQIRSEMMECPFPGGCPLVQTYDVLRLRTTLQHGDNPEHILVIDWKVTLGNLSPEVIPWLRRVHEHLRRPTVESDGRMVKYDI